MHAQVLLSIMAYFVSSIVPYSSSLRLCNFKRGFTGDLGDAGNDNDEVESASSAFPEREKTAAASSAVDGEKAPEPAARSESLEDIVAESCPR